MLVPSPSARLDFVPYTVEQAEVDMALSMAAFSAGDLAKTQRLLTRAREALVRAAATVKRRGAAGVR